MNGQKRKYAIRQQRGNHHPKLFNAGVEYAIDALLYLNDAGSARKSAEIAEETGVPKEYFIQLAQSLRECGIIKSCTGRAGGYELAKPASQITVLSIVSSVYSGRQARKQAEGGLRESGRSGPLALIEAEIAELLSEMSLSDLARVSAKGRD